MIFHYKLFFYTWNSFAFEGLGQNTGGPAFDSAGIIECLTQGLHIMPIDHTGVPARGKIMQNCRNFLKI